MSIMNFSFDFVILSTKYVTWYEMCCRFIQGNINSEFYIFSLLHRACCWITQLLYQLLHIYKIYKIYTLKN